MLENIGSRPEQTERLFMYILHTRAGGFLDLHKFKQQVMWLVNVLHDWHYHAQRPSKVVK